MSRAARVGAFIIVALAILVSGIFIIGGKLYLFRSTYRLSAQFGSVVGLDSGADVRVGGVHSGSVRSVELPNRPTDKITVWMDLDQSTRNIVKQDSTATIETEGLLGNEYVAISFGSAKGANVSDGGSIGSEPPIEMAALVKKTDRILDTSQVALTNVAQVTANLSSISGKIDSGQGTVGALINDKNIYNQMDQATSGMRETVTQAQAGVSDFKENMEALKSNFLLRGYYKKRGYDDSSDLVKNEIARLPQAEPLKTFTYQSQMLFDKVDTAKPKNQKSLRAAGQFLADNEFGVAVVVVSAGMAGDTAKDLVLTQARAMVIRDYLVNNFGFDDTELKTFGAGKKEGSSPDSGWGTVEILIYPPETDVSTNAQNIPDRK
jgi:phospholipid/cholesterol/gamma-HCH transport system substrate-binding protein